MTREQAQFLMSQIPSDTALAIAHAKEDIANDKAKHMMTLDLERTFGKEYATAYYRYVNAWYTMEEFKNA
jgi:hypothetical protein